MSSITKTSKTSRSSGTEGPSHIGLAFLASNPEGIHGGDAVGAVDRVEPIFQIPDESTYEHSSTEQNALEYSIHRQDEDAQDHHEEIEEIKKEGEPGFKLNLKA